METLVTSDTHFGHRRILEFGRGKFYKSVEEMDEDLILRWNEAVKPGDRVYHLGDVAVDSTGPRVAEIFRRLNGSIFLVPGNHDHGPRLTSLYPLVLVVDPIHHIKWHKHKIVLCHFPQMSWDDDRRGSWHLHGHCHNGLIPFTNTLNPNGRFTDVGVDTAWGRAPVNLNVIEEYMKDRENRTQGSF